MIVYDMPQGTPEWHAARAGVCTASRFSTARTRVGGLTDQQAEYVKALKAGQNEREAMSLAGYKAKPRAAAIDAAMEGRDTSEPGKTALDYAFGLAIERISGAPLDDGFENYFTRRGHELEATALDLYEVETGRMVQRCGFVCTDDRKFGASADGLVGADGGVEVKCWVDPVKLRAVLTRADISDVRDQCMGGMWVTGRKWWDFVLYCPALDPIGRALTIIRIDRDDNAIDALESDLLAFDRVVEGYRKQLEQAA